MSIMRPTGKDKGADAMKVRMVDEREGSQTGVDLRTMTRMNVKDTSWREWEKKSDPGPGARMKPDFITSKATKGT